jgi:GNAT superfamily N-acetyltransferase
MNELDIRFVPQDSKLYPELTQRIDALDRLAFAGQADPEGAEGIEWASDGEYTELGFIDGQLVSQLFLLKREIRVGRQQTLVAGVGGVATHPNVQRRGLGLQLMNAATPFMRDIMDVPFGLLVCAPETQPFYVKAGWVFVAPELVYTQGGHDRTLPASVMIIKLKDQDWPAGRIHLCGAPW